LPKKVGKPAGAKTLKAALANSKKIASRKK
jgi:hypothetical protein